MVYFSGSLKLMVLEAKDLRPTDFATRHQMNKLTQIDPYISIDIDDVLIARTQSKSKTNRPVWNENFQTEVHNGQIIGLTVFHDAAIPPDEFVANCFLPLEEFKTNPDSWVSHLVLLFTYISKHTSMHINTHMCIFIDCLTFIKPFTFFPFHLCFFLLFILFFIFFFILCFPFHNFIPWPKMSPDSHRFFSYFIMLHTHTHIG